MTSSHDRSRRDGQRWASILVGAAIVAGVGWMTLEAQQNVRPVKKDDAGAPASATAVDTAPPADAGGPGPAETDGGLFLPTLSLDDAGLMLPSGAPRSVKLGVVLVSFAGAEGAPASARSKKDAQAFAERLSADARSDFHHAVTSGNPGSADDIGRLPRGVLDPRTEVAVFALAPGEVSAVLETPRGYWIVKRIE